MRFFLGFLLFLALPACTLDFDDPTQDVGELSENLFFAPDFESSGGWQLRWRGEPDERLHYGQVRFEQESLDSASRYTSINPERTRSTRYHRSRCGRTHQHTAERVEEPLELQGAGPLADVAGPSLEPGRYRVVVDRIDDEALLAEFVVDGLNDADVRRFDARVAEVKAGACRTQPYRTDSLQGAFMSRLDPATLVTLFENRELWPSSSSPPEDYDYWLELAERNATTTVLGNLIVNSTAPPENFWNLARDVHQPFFVQWLSPRLDFTRELTSFEQTVLENGSWTPEVMDYVSNRIDLLRRGNDTREQLLDLARLLQVAPNKFGEFYPEQAQWIESAFHIGVGFGCCGAYASACGFGRRVPACEQAIEELKDEFGLGPPPVPTLHIENNPLQSLGI